MTVDIIEKFKNRIELLLPYVAPILVYPRINTGFSDWITGGSALIAQTVSSRFLITADHFLAKIDQLHQKSGALALLAISGASLIDITKWPVIVRDDYVDLCTIQVPDESESTALEGHYFLLDLLQAPRASIGDQALILGFPQLHRGVSGENRINTRVLPIVDHVTDVADRRFTIADEKNGREISINPHNLSFPDHVGGMSGAPVFRISEASSAILIGILSEAGDGLHGAYFCSHAKYLLPDGTLDVNGLPPRL